MSTTSAMFLSVNVVVPSGGSKMKLLVPRSSERRVCVVHQVEWAQSGASRAGTAVVRALLK